MWPPAIPKKLAFTRYCFTSRLICTNQSSARYLWRLQNPECDHLRFHRSACLKDIVLLRISLKVAEPRMWPPEIQKKAVFTRYCFTSRLICTNQPSFYCLPPPALPTRLHYYCITIAQYAIPLRTPCVCHTPYNIGHDNVVWRLKKKAMFAATAGTPSRLGLNKILPLPILCGVWQTKGGSGWECAIDVQKYCNGANNTGGGGT